jgi:hypothetical protein
MHLLSKMLSNELSCSASIVIQYDIRIGSENVYINGFIPVQGHSLTSNSTSVDIAPIFNMAAALTGIDQETANTFELECSYNKYTMTYDINIKSHKDY